MTEIELISRLKDAHSLFGDPLHRESWEEIKRLKETERKLLQEIKVLRESLNFWAYIAMVYEEEDK